MPYNLGETYTSQASGDHSATVIFLHGLGDTGENWARNLGALKLDHVKFVCPTAPIQKVTLNHGLKMPSWFDIKGLDPTSEEDQAGIMNAASSLKAAVEAEVSAGIPANRIVVAGFSQGGATAIYSALSVLGCDVAGVVLLSTWLPLSSQFQNQEAKFNLKTRILQCHGHSDLLIPLKWGKMTSMILTALTKNCTFKEYPEMGHESTAQEMRDVKQFLMEVLPPSK